MPDPSEAKTSLRRAARERLRPLTPADRDQRSRDAAARLAALPLWTAARAVMLYAPLASEPDPGPAAQTLFAAPARTVALPRVDWDRGLMHPARITAWGSGLTEPLRGVREPGPDAPGVDPGALDLVVVPGVSFDLRGGRLGRGAGFYDRFLAGLRAVRVGLCFDEQVVDEVPMEPGDVRMQVIVTPTRVVVVP